VQESFITGKMPGATTTKFQSQTTGVSQLLSGSIDAFVLGGPDAGEYLKRYSMLKIAVAAPVDHATAVAMPKTHTALVTAWDSEVAGMVSDGTFTRIYSKWFPKEAPRPELIKIWPGLAGAGPATGAPASAPAATTDSGS
jgi:polar amino acid transport system substrate-binding protein